MADYTEHYQLHQWEAEDPFLRADFNEDLQKIDTALGGLSIERIAHGSYVGDGTDSRVIQLPWEPQLLILFGKINDYTAVNIFTPYADRYVASTCGGGSRYNLVLEGDYFQIRNRDWNNHNGETFHYILIR